MSALRTAALPLALLALATAGPAQVTEDSAPAGVSPAQAQPQVDLERELAAVAEIDAFVAQRKGAPPREQEAAMAFFREYRDGMLALEAKHYGTWAGWQA
ncbi:MAG: hypothetical protein H8E31_14635, partial [Planctomycetes bacterium]|nr:hypothetical protein [Planctomycetota bacterium]